MTATQASALTIAPERTAEEASPVELCDVLLAAALAASADYFWIEPVPGTEQRYSVSLQQENRTLAMTTVPSALGMAAIARLAFLCEIDLLTTRTRTGSTRLRRGDRECELVLTLRPGPALRAEGTLVRRSPRLLLAGQRYAELTLGEQVDHYRVLAHLGAGGMGSVYKAEHVSLGRVHALKVLHGAVLARDHDASQRFLREARAASRIQHPNIVDVFDFGYLRDGRPYFVMELLSGASLGDLIDRGALPPPKALAIAKQLACALAAAHERGVIHADVTPSNVLVSDDESLSVKLVDFGLAELRDGLERPDDPNSEYVLGTPSYISPEQIRGQGATELSDQYSLGVVLYEMLVGRPPFADRNVRELCLKHLREPAPEPVTPTGPLPPELVALVLRCLEKAPAQRYPSLRAMLLELEHVESIVERRGWRRWLVRRAMEQASKTLPLVVCVDDDAEVLAVVVRCAKMEAVTVRSTQDPHQALTWVAAEEVAVLISDYEMPEMSGADLLEAVRKVRPATVRVLVTGRKTLDTAIEGINRGEVYRYVSKPFEAERVRAVVREAVAKYHELAEGRQERELAQRRTQLTAELEHEFPGITSVPRDRDGAYVPSDGSRKVPGLDDLRALLPP